MSKRSYTRIAEHFGQDEQDIKDSEYQPGRFSTKVYIFAGEYYAGKKPKDTDGFMSNWHPINSSYDGSQLWHHAVEKSI